MSDTVERDAFFLAGHAIGAWLEGFHVRRISVVPDNDATCWIEVDEPVLPTKGPFLLPKHRQSARSLIRALLAGPAALERYSFGVCCGDLFACREILGVAGGWRAINLARRLDSHSVEELLWRQTSRAINLSESWEQISFLATMLLERGMMFEHELAFAFSPRATHS